METKKVFCEGCKHYHKYNAEVSHNTLKDVCTSKYVRDKYSVQDEIYENYVPNFVFCAIQNKHNSCEAFDELIIEIKIKQTKNLIKKLLGVFRNGPEEN